MSKRLMNDSRAKLRPRLLASHQWGVTLPGGAEALVHWRSTIEDLASQGVIEPLVCFDLDLKNMFGSIEWPSIRAFVAAHFEDAAAWTEWTHREPAIVQFPHGAEAIVDRGAEHGDTARDATLRSVIARG